MNGNDESSVVAVEADRLIEGCHTQGKNVTSVLKSNRSTFKIDKLCIKLGIVKEKGDAKKCNHFSLRGYVAGMREKGSKNASPFTEQLPPMDVPNFRYWLCQRCLQNNGTENDSKVCDEVAVLPFGEGTSGVKPVDVRNGDENIVAADGSRPSKDITEKVELSREIPEKVKVFQGFPKFCSIHANVTAPSYGEINENPQETSVKSLVSQPIESGQQNESPYGNPRRKARKVRLLKELLCGNSQPTESGQQKKVNFQIKRKMLHERDPDHDNDHDQRIVEGKKVKTFKGNDHDHDRRIVEGKKVKTFKGNDHDHDQIIVDGKKVKTFKGNDHDHGQRIIDGKKVKTFKGNELDHDQTSVDGKKAKTFNGNSIAKNSVAETSKNLETSKFQWKKHGAERSLMLGKTGSDAMTAWRTIFSDMRRTDNQVPPYGASKCRETEPYSNLMGQPKSNKKVNFSKKKTNNPLKSKHFGEDLMKTKDRQSDRELGLGLSLNYDPQSQLQSPPFASNKNPCHDHSRKAGFYMEESSFANRIPLGFKSKEGLGHDLSNINAPRTAFLQEKRPYTQLPYGNCSGHHKLDFSDPHKRNGVVRGYSDITRPQNPQRQENMFSIGRSDEHEIIELLAKNQYERNLSEARSHFAPSGSNSSGIIPNTSSFHSFNMNEGMTRKTSENMGLPTTMRNPNTASGYFHQEKVSSFGIFDGQKQPYSSGVWISDSRHQIPQYSHYNNFSNGNSKTAHTHLYPPPMPFGQPFGQPFSQPYAKYSEKDKGKNMMDLDLNVVASNVVEEQNNLESLRSLDSSYCNEAIPAMQLLSLMDAGKSSQPFNKNGQKFSTKTLSPCYSNGSSTVTEKANSMVNSPFPYSGLRPGVQKPIPSSFSNVFHTGQNVKLTPSQSQQVYYKQQEEKLRGCVPEDSYPFPLPWNATVHRNKVINDGGFGNRFNSSKTEICTINRNPADFTTPGPDNVYMINPEDLRIKSGNSGIYVSENTYGPKRQNISGFQ